MAENTAEDDKTTNDAVEEIDIPDIAPDDTAGLDDGIEEIEIPNINDNAGEEEDIAGLDEGVEEIEIPNINDNAGEEEVFEEEEGFEDGDGFEDEEGFEDSLEGSEAGETNEEEKEDKKDTESKPSSYKKAFWGILSLAILLIVAVGVQTVMLLKKSKAPQKNEKTTQEKPLEADDMRPIDDIVSQKVSEVIQDNSIDRVKELLEGEHFFRKKLYTEALRKLSQVKKRFDKLPVPIKLDINMGSANIGNLVLQFKKILSMYRNLQEAYFFSGLAYQEQQQYERAIEEFDKVIQIDSESINSYINIGRNLRHLNRTREALDAFLQALEIDGDNVSALHNLGNCYYLTGYFGESEAVFKNLLCLNPNDLSSRYNLGLALQQQGKFEEAIGEYEEILKNSPKDTDALYNMALINIEQGELYDAEDLYKKILGILSRQKNASKRKLSEVHLLMAKIAYKDNRHDEALNTLKFALQQDRGNYLVLTALGNHYYKSDNYEKAIYYFQQATADKRMADSEGFARLGDAFFAAKDYSSALPNYREAVKREVSKHSPVFLKAMSKIGKILFGNGQVKEAKGVFEEILKYAPGTSSAYHFLGMISFSEGDMGKAEEDYKLSIESDPSFAPNYYYLGMVYQKLGELKKAIPLFEKSIQMDKKFKPSEAIKSLSGQNKKEENKEK